MGKNHKTILMQRSRDGINRAIYGRPVFGTAYALLHQFLSLTTLSRRNIMWAAKCVQAVRENPAMGIENIEVQEKLLQLDRAVVEAKARLQRREEKRERKKAEAEQKEPRRKKDKPTEPALGASPWDSNSDFYKRLLAEEKKEQEKKTEEKENQLPASGDNNANH